MKADHGRWPDRSERTIRRGAQRAPPKPTRHTPDRASTQWLTILIGGHQKGGFRRGAGRFSDPTAAADVTDLWLRRR